MNTFPLLSLPFVPVREVLQLWNPIEIVEFSFCSKKTYTIAKKILNKSKKVALVVHEYSGRQIDICSPGKRFEIAISKREGGIPEGCYEAVINKHSLSIAADTNEPKMTTYWEDENIGLNELTKYIADIFNYPRLTRVCLDTKHKNPSLLRWIYQQYPGRVERLSITTNTTRTSQADIKRLLDSCCKLSQSVLFFSRPLPRFQYEFNFDLMEWFILKGAKWIKLDHLIALTNQTIHLILLDTSLTNQTLNIFLKDWISSELVLKTKKLIVRGDKLNINEIFLGIEREEREEDPDVIEQLPVLNVFPHNAIRAGFNIIRENGVKALITTHTSNKTVLVQMCIQSEYSAPV